MTIEPDWLSDHVAILPEDRVRIDPDVWAQLADFVERREAIRATYQTFAGRVSEYELHPYHLLAYRGNWQERCGVTSRQSTIPARTARQLPVIFRPLPAGGGPRL